MWKVITAIVADQITFLSEKHQLLPKHHFGGHPGCTTTDAMHLLMLRIKAAWCLGKVAAILFLDIKGTFLNAVPERLVHNLRKWKLPTKYINFVNNMLHDRVTMLKFNSFASDAIQINNSISQGDPLSMVLYQFYNANLLDIPNSRDKDAMAFVDNSFRLVVVDSFEEVHIKLADMMGRVGSVAEWSTCYDPGPYHQFSLIFHHFILRSWSLIPHSFPYAPLGPPLNHLTSHLMDHLTIPQSDITCHHSAVRSTPQHHHLTYYGLPAHCHIMIDRQLMMELYLELPAHDEPYYT